MEKKQPHYVDVHVGSRVRLRRMLKGVSQEQLGEHLNLTFQQIQKYEKGANRISASRLWEIAEVLSVPISFFYEGLTSAQNMATGLSDQPQAELMNFVSSTEGRQLNRHFVTIPDSRVRRKILDLVKSLSEAMTEKPVKKADS